MSEKKDEKKKDLFLGKELEETDIPTKKGKTPAYDWNKVLVTINKGKVREINSDAVSKATIMSAVKSYNESNDTKLQVVSRTMEDKSVRLFIRNGA